MYTAEKRRVTTVGMTEGFVKSALRGVMRWASWVEDDGMGGSTMSVVVTWRVGEEERRAVRRAWPTKPAPPVMRM